MADNFERSPQVKEAAERVLGIVPPRDRLVRTVLANVATLVVSDLLRGDGERRLELTRVDAATQNALEVIRISAAELSALVVAIGEWRDLALGRASLADDPRPRGKRGAR